MHEESAKSCLVEGDTTGRHEALLVLQSSQEELKMTLKKARETRAEASREIEIKVPKIASK